MAASPVSRRATMQASVTCAYGGPEMLIVTELPDPAPANGEMLIAVRHAFVLSTSTLPLAEMIAKAER